MGAVKRKLEMIEDFASRFEGGMITASELSNYVVSSVVGDEVREYFVEVYSFEGWWYAILGTPDNPEAFEQDLGRFASGSPSEEEHLACVDALFAVPGIIIEID